ncbi:MAG: hypothetical protein GF308_02370 [Candidatus Heimdallarchaeota archaeon]|nr:hypothetical protein [Candidatus Heimdallarchaeota archaeon]
MTFSKATAEERDYRKYYPVIEVFHGVNNSPKYYGFHLYCEKVLVPFNLVFEGKIKTDYVHFLKEQKIEIIVDSGAAAYYLNSERGYPADYLLAYLSFLEEVKPCFAFALDSCFEKEQFRTWSCLQENFERQERTIEKVLAAGLKTPIYPVVQGWGYFSYTDSAREVRRLLKNYSLKRFGIGSICRGKAKRVKKVLSWVNTILPLDQAHAFGQTQRTAAILKEFEVGSLDSSNAAGNAGRICYCDPKGTWYYSRKSQQGKRKHDLDTGFQTPREKYNHLFKMNVESLELACYNEIPDWWIHPVIGISSTEIEEKIGENA